MEKCQVLTDEQVNMLEEAIMNRNPPLPDEDMAVRLIATLRHVQAELERVKKNSIRLLLDAPKIEQENARLREALEFYRTTSEYDGGERANEALATEGEMDIDSAPSLLRDGNCMMCTNCKSQWLYFIEHGTTDCSKCNTNEHVVVVG